ncbi:hypothetical protein FisN_10Hu057 [Fistulifera solaris]|jgi:hypothetical protein|uniref:Uncharacterized protein n=1 Tax=Fistulifera solaris TaxID=1519565 RepID=A0A1Z5K6A8_FISSO|nr:hypothetical protein FisN_10Hu057 [Fistulifera solaris]|eukprot:GAX21478.1 hypothetical protein FisN_10Hu057 [Fistulifera solaris]
MICDQIETDLQVLAVVTDVLRDSVVPDENPFETRVGEFNTFGHDYLEARGELAKSYWEAAHDSDVKDVWELSLFHFLEISRLDATGTSSAEARHRVPFILLYLNRDDDAFASILAPI